jgi:hypothetical protein
LMSLLARLMALARTASGTCGAAVICQQCNTVQTMSMTVTAMQGTDSLQEQQSPSARLMPAM